MFEKREKNPCYFKFTMKINVDQQKTELYLDDCVCREVLRMMLEALKIGLVHDLIWLKDWF